MKLMKFTPKGKPNATAKIVRVDRVRDDKWILVTDNLHMTEGKRTNFWLDTNYADIDWIREFTQKGENY